LRAELTRLGLTFDEATTVRVELDGRGVHELLRAIETPLTLVRTHAPTLEDAYLAIVGREEDAA
jgi:ABC-2 type transport system ATP-binding protein